MLLLRGFGFLLLILGGIGLVLPVWPTTIFWILAAWVFARSAPEWRDWLYARPRVGADIALFVERGRMRRSAKFSALAGIALSIAFAAWSLQGQVVALAIVLAITMGLAVWIVLRPGPDAAEQGGPGSA